MADVHPLGDVRRRIVDHDPLIDQRGSDAKSRVAEPLGHAVPDGGVVYLQVEEARSGHLGPVEPVAEALGQGLGQPLGDRPRRLPEHRR